MSPNASATKWQQNFLYRVISCWSTGRKPTQMPSHSKPSAVGSRSVPLWQHRALDLNLITKAQFFTFYQQDREEWERRKAEEKLKKAKGGPNFYDVQDSRLGRRFAYAVVCAAREGRLPYRHAYQLTDLKGETFDRYANLLTQRMKDERR